MLDQLNEGNPNKMAKAAKRLGEIGEHVVLRALRRAKGDISFDVTAAPEEAINKFEQKDPFEKFKYK